MDKAANLALYQVVSMRAILKNLRKLWEQVRKLEPVSDQDEELFDRVHELDQTDNWASILGKQISNCKGWLSGCPASYMGS